MIYRAAICLLTLFAWPTVLLAHGDLHEVITKLDKKIEASPDNTLLLLERAGYLRQHKNFKGALLDLKRVEKLKPELMGRHLVLAKIYRDQKLWK